MYKRINQIGNYSLVLVAQCCKQNCGALIYHFCALLSRMIKHCPRANTSSVATTESVHDNFVGI